MNNKVLWVNEKKYITGPAGILLNTRGELLCVIEREGKKQQKSRKRAGQLFVPAGKQRLGESMEDTMLREIWEETWIKKEFDIIENAKLKKKGRFSLETNDTNIDIEVFQYQTELDVDILDRYKDFYHHEIIQRAFFDIREVLEFDIDKIRPWLLEILYIFYGWKIDATVKIENGIYAKEERKRIVKMKQDIDDLL